MKILFLDMDGVINTSGKDKYSLSLILPYDFENNKDFFYFDTRILFNFVKLLEFCKDNEIKIVISSTWRIGTTIDGWNKFLYKYFRNSLRMKITDNLVIGLTNNKFNGIRGLQIGSWLDEYNTISKDKIEKYLIVDDEIVDIKPYLPKKNILKINSKDGLTEEKITEIINYFTKGSKLDDEDN